MGEQLYWDGKGATVFGREVMTDLGWRTRKCGIDEDMTVPVDKPIIFPVLIGRAPQLEALGKLLNQTSSGHGQMLLLSGEAGIGKSRLVAELKTSALAHRQQPDR